MIDGSLSLARDAARTADCDVDRLASMHTDVTVREATFAAEGTDERRVRFGDGTLRLRIESLGKEALLELSARQAGGDGAVSASASFVPVEGLCIGRDAVAIKRWSVEAGLSESTFGATTVGGHLRLSDDGTRLEGSGELSLNDGTVEINTDEHLELSVRTVPLREWMYPLLGRLNPLFDVPHGRLEGRMNGTLQLSRSADGGHDGSGSISMDAFISDGSRFVLALRDRLGELGGCVEGQLAPTALRVSKGSVSYDRMTLNLPDGSSWLFSGEGADFRTEIVLPQEALERYRRGHPNDENGDRLKWRVGLPTVEGSRPFRFVSTSNYTDLK